LRLTGASTGDEMLGSTGLTSHLSSRLQRSTCRVGGGSNHGTRGVWPLPGSNPFPSLYLSPPCKPPADGPDLVDLPQKIRSPGIRQRAIGSKQPNRGSRCGEG